MGKAWVKRMHTGTIPPSGLLRSLGEHDSAGPPATPAGVTSPAQGQHLGTADRPWRVGAVLREHVSEFTGTAHRALGHGEAWGRARTSAGRAQGLQRKSPDKPQKWPELAFSGRGRRLRTAPGAPLLPRGSSQPSRQLGLQRVHTSAQMVSIRLRRCWPLSSQI